jgi:hypothetical protein
LPLLTQQRIQDMTYIKEKNDFINEIIDHIRQKIEVLDERTDIEVKFLLSKPLRNDNPSVEVQFINAQVLAEAQFWSGKTFDFSVYDNLEGEVLEGGGGYFTSLDDVDVSIDKIIAYYLPSTAHTDDLK